MYSVPKNDVPDIFRRLLASEIVSLMNMNTGKSTNTNNERRQPRPPSISARVCLVGHGKYSGMYPLGYIPEYRQ